MAEILEHTPKPVEQTETRDDRQYVLERYDNAIRYYWKASAINKRLYKWTRYLVVVLGAVVTLLASLSASEAFVSQWGRAITVTTPILAALLTIIGGLSQSFQYGPAWQEMVLTAERLERERDRISVTRGDLSADMDKLHQMVLQESEGFFARILGSVQATPKLPDS